MSKDMIHVVAHEDSNFSLLGRITYGNGYATQADVSAITWKAFDVNDPATVYDSGSLMIADTVFDSLQTGDLRWKKDAVGFNFLHTHAYDAFEPGRYLVEYTVIWSAGGQVVLRPIFNVRVVPVRSS
jgi:hypothetical protein